MHAAMGPGTGRTGSKPVVVADADRRGEHGRSTSFYFWWWRSFLIPRRFLAAMERCLRAHSCMGWFENQPHPNRQDCNFGGLIAARPHSVPLRQQTPPRQLLAASFKIDYCDGKPKAFSQAAQGCTVAGDADGQSMRYRRLGHTDLEVSVLGFGASPLGDVFFSRFSPPPENRLHRSATSARCGVWGCRADRR